MKSNLDFFTHGCGSSKGSMGAMGAIVIILEMLAQPLTGFLWRLVRRGGLADDLKLPALYGMVLVVLDGTKRGFEAGLAAATTMRVVPDSLSVWTRHLCNTSSWVR